MKTTEVSPTVRTIILTPTLKGWMATQLIDGEPDMSLVDLFGTHILPTAFTAQASGEYVLCEIQRMNPDAIVCL